MKYGGTLRDPWGMNKVMTPHYPPVMMPPQHATQVIYTSPHVRQLVQWLMHHHYGR